MNNKPISRRNFLKLLGGGIAVTASSLYGCDTLTRPLTDDPSTEEAPTDKMEYRTSPDGRTRVSLLGFGAMRLPRFGDDEQAPVNRQRFDHLVDYALQHGVNYFDTAPEYSRGESERIVGESLHRHERHRYLLATKLSNFDDHSREYALAMYRQSLANLQTDHIDFYALQEVKDRKSAKSRFVDNGMLDFLVGERNEGRIGHLGWVCRGDADTFDYMMSLGVKWDFVELPLNYCDWRHGEPLTAEYLYNELTQRGIPVIVTETLLGSNLAQLPDMLAARLKEKSPRRSAASWAFRFAGSLPNVLTVLSNMTHKEHIRDNVITYSPLQPCSPRELDFLEEIARTYATHPLIPCIACHRCMPCPYGIDIVAILRSYNKCVNEGNIASSTRDENYRKARKAFLVNYARKVAPRQQADHCLLCGECVHKCPRRIKIPAMMVRIGKYVEALKQDTL